MSIVEDSCDSVTRLYLGQGWLIRVTRIDNVTILRRADVQVRIVNSASYTIPELARSSL